MSRNLVGKMFPYAAVTQSSGCRALKLDRNTSYIEVERQIYTQLNHILLTLLEKFSQATDAKNKDHC